MWGGGIGEDLGLASLLPWLERPGFPWRRVPMPVGVGGWDKAVMEDKKMWSTRGGVEGQEGFSRCSAAELEIRLGG